MKKLDATKERAERDRLTSKLVEVREQLKAVRTTVQFAEPKTSRSRRTITIPALVADTLRAHRTRGSGRTRVPCSGLHPVHLS